MQKTTVAVLEDQEIIAKEMMSEWFNFGELNQRRVRMWTSLQIKETMILKM